MVVVERVSFEVDGERVVGELHLPEPVDHAAPGVVVAGPMTSVKEQVCGTYAAAMAAKGFVALAIDHRHYGESGGSPRQYEYYPHKLEDLRAAIEFVKTDGRIDAKEIYGLGICLGSGYLARAVADDSQGLKAFAAVAGYYRDVEEMKANDRESFDSKVEAGRRARLNFEQTGNLEVIPAVLPPGQGDAAMTMQSTFDYYGPGGRAAVANYTNEFAVMSREFFLAFDVQSAAPKLTMPFLQLHGPNAIAPKLADRFFDQVTRVPSKKRITLTSKGQTDIYDDPAIVAFAADHVADFFAEAAKAEVLD